MSQTENAISMPSQQRGFWGLAVLPLVLLVLAARMFAGGQSIWVDESTQLSGLTLGPIELLSWLTGSIENPFPVPGDCSPPVSYWVGKLWVSLFGLSETALRWLALVVVATTAWIVMLAATRAFGRRAGLVGICLFVLSPNVVEQAVNIRPYPFLMLFSAVAAYSMIRLSERTDKSWRWYALLVAALLLACYTHFFGAVLAGACLGTLLILVSAKRLPVKPVGVAVGVFSILVLGILPFLRASFQVLGSGATEQGSDSLRAFARLFYRMFFHASISVSSLVMVALALGLVALAAQILIRRRLLPCAAVTIILVLGLGVAALVAGRLLVSDLMTEPRYSVWFYPFLAIGLAAAFRSGPPPVQPARSSWAGFLLICIAFLFGDYQLSLHGRWFSHVRFTEVRQLVDQLGPSDVNVVYEGLDGPTGHLAFPMTYHFGPALGQFAEQGDETTPRHFREFRSNERVDWGQVTSRPFLIVARLTTENSKQIVEQLRHGVRDPGSPSELARELEEAGGWTLIETRRWVAFARVDLAVYRRD